MGLYCSQIKTIFLLPIQNICLKFFTWSDLWETFSASYLPTLLFIHYSLLSLTFFSIKLMDPHLCLRVFAHVIPSSCNTLHPNIMAASPYHFHSSRLKSKIITSKWTSLVLWESPLHYNYSMSFCKVSYSERLRPPNNLICLHLFSASQPSFWVILLNTVA